MENVYSNLRLSDEEDFNDKEVNFSDSECGGMSSAEEDKLDLDLGLNDDSSDLESFWDETSNEDEEEHTSNGGIGESTGNKKMGAKRKRVHPGRNSGKVGGRKNKTVRDKVGRITMVTKGYKDVDIPNELPPFAPSRPTGIHIENVLLQGGLTTELEFFNLFFTAEMIDCIVTHTNACAYMKLAEGGHNSYFKGDGIWEETNAAEICRFIALLIYFSLVRVDLVEKYWSTKTIYHGLWARNILSRTRFKALMAFLHILDPSVENPDEMMCKVVFFVKLFKYQCKMLYQPTQNMSVEERLMSYTQDKSGIRQCGRGKRIRWGAKLWVLVDSCNGFTVDFDIYIGKSAYGEVSENGLGYHVVMKLAKPYFNQGYYLFFDEFYTSFKLVSDLFSCGTPSTGLVSIKKVDFPTSLKDVKTWAKTVEWGSMRWERLSNVLGLQWVDRQPVSILTTINSANDKSLSHRKVKIDGKFEKVDIFVPKVIQSYDQCANVVDRLDKNIICNNVAQKCYRWWKTLFFHLIDMSVVNSFILFQEHRSRNANNKDLEREDKYSIIEFREALVRQICGLPQYDVPPAYECVKPVHDYESVHMPLVSETGRKNCTVCYKAGRGQLKVSTYCSAPQCGKFLHIKKKGEKNCFQVWHSKDYHDKK